MTHKKTERNAEIVRRYVEGQEKIVSLAAEYGVCRARIRHILDDAGVVRRGRWPTAEQRAGR